LAVDLDGGDRDEQGEQCEQCEQCDSLRGQDPAGEPGGQRMRGQLGGDAAGWRPARAEGLACSRVRLIRSAAVRNRDLPRPSTTGLTMTRTSSTSPIPIRLTVSAELPMISMSLLGSCLSLASTSATLSRISCVEVPWAVWSVREMTIGARPFILAATAWSSCSAAGWASNPPSSRRWPTRTAGCRPPPVAAGQLVELRVHDRPVEGLAGALVVAVEAGEVKREQLSHRNSLHVFVIATPYTFCSLRLLAAFCPAWAPFPECRGKRLAFTTLARPGAGG